MDRQGQAFAFSGGKMLGVHGASVGEQCVAAGNLLANADVPAAMTPALSTDAQTALGDRLVAALQAGLAAGGEAGAVHSAALLIVTDAAFPYASLRIDWHEDDRIDAVVIGAPSSGAQIADDLHRAGRRVFLSVGPRDRPPRRYRGRDFAWWLGALGLWDAKATQPNCEHVTLAVSGVDGCQTVDFRRLAASGITLTGMPRGFADGKLEFAPDLAANIALGDANLRAMLDAADAYVAREGLGLPEEPEAGLTPPDPACVTPPLLDLELAQAGVRSIVWATGYALDFGWIETDAFDERARPLHDGGISQVPGLNSLVSRG